jgi:outer membrane usher protein
MFLLPAAVPERIERMSRPPTRYRWPALFIAIGSLALAGPAFAQVDAAAQVAPSAASLEPAPFQSEPERNWATMPDAGAAGEHSASTSEVGPAALSQDATQVPQPSQGPADEGTPAFLNAAVNEIDIGDVLVLLRGNDVLIKVDDLEKPGLHVSGGAREKHGEDVLISLRSLAPQITFVFSERALSLTITADAKLFGGTVLDLHATRPEGIIYRTAPSLFANYMVRGGELQSPDQAMASGLGEAGLSLGGHLLYASGQRSAVDGSWERLLTNLTFDVRSHLTSIVLGDAQAISDALGGAAMMGGLSVARNFGLDPYYVFLPTQRISGTALTPSTVEVYVNGQLVRRESLPPGQFTMQNLPVTTGSGQTQVLIRDAFGNTQTTVSPYYLALGTLARGLHDYSYNIGLMRQNYGTESWNYSQPSLLFRHRVGVTNWLTVGARVEGALHFDQIVVGPCSARVPHMLSGGPSLAIRLPVGEVGALAALSGQGRFFGSAALLSYSYISPLLGFQIGARWQSRDYANLSQAPSSLTPTNTLPAEAALSQVPLSNDRHLFDVTTSVSKNISKVATVSLQYEGTEWRDQGWNNRTSLMVNRTISRWMYVFATVSNIYRRGFPAEYDTFAGLSFTPADRVTAGATRSDHWGGQSKHGGATQAIVQQSLPLGSGLGYRVVAAQGESDLNEADVQYQGAYGRIEGDYQHQGYGDNRGHVNLTATGGLVLIGGRPFLTRNLQSSYALIRVPDVDGVHGLMSNQVVGTTNGKGDLLVPNLLPYYGNRIGIDDKDIPLDHDIGTTERIIAPPFRGGVVVTFPVRLVLSVSGTVVIEDKGATILPAYGQIIVNVAKQPVVSPLDEAGNFYLENVPPGTYSAEVQYATGVCTFPLIVSQGSTALVNVGTVKCIVPPKEMK